MRLSGGSPEDRPLTPMTGAAATSHPNRASTRREALPPQPGAGDWEPAPTCVPTAEHCRHRHGGLRCRKRPQPPRGSRTHALHSSATPAGATCGPARDTWGCDALRGRRPQESAARLTAERRGAWGAHRLTELLLEGATRVPVGSPLPAQQPSPFSTQQDGLCIRPTRK